MTWKLPRKFRTRNFLSIFPEFPSGLRFTAICYLRPKSVSSFLFLHILVCWNGEREWIYAECSCIVLFLSHFFLFMEIKKASTILRARKKRDSANTNVTRVFFFLYSFVTRLWEPRSTCARIIFFENSEETSRYPSASLLHSDIF